MGRGGVARQPVELYTTASIITAEALLHIDALNADAIVAFTEKTVKQLNGSFLLRLLNSLLTS